MDRNFGRDAPKSRQTVALRKESVDRNDFPVVPVELTTVALRKESVDRNVDPDADTLTDDVSLSVRRAWIEMEEEMEEESTVEGRSP